jgi:2-methylcitrate dehydratase PrpD
LSISRQASAWLHGLRYEDLPAEVVHQSKRHLLDWLGVLVGGATHETVMIVERTARTMGGGAPQATSIGSGTRHSVTQAALANGVAAHVLDYDDTHLPTSVHPTSPVASAALAVAEWKQLSGRDLILAHVVGVEIECQLGLSVSPGHYAAGWHSTSTLGTIGASAAVCKLLGLDEDATNRGLGIAAAQAGGFREAFGTMVKSFHVGKAASNGVLAGLLGAEGLTSADDPIGGRRGFASVFSDTFDRETVGELGSWQILDVSLKPYSCGVVVHPSIDGMRWLHGKHGFKVSDVESVDLRVHPLVVDLTGIEQPTTGLQGKFSVYYAVASALLDGNVREQQFTDQQVRRPEAAALLPRIRAQVDNQLGSQQAVVSVTLADGRVLEQRVDAALGTPANPLSDDAVAEKFASLVQPVIGGDRADDLAARVFALQDMGSVDELIEMLKPGFAAES